jgi:4-diphosphocytidyl-2-C-methyl-D-erythritol kinase
MVEHGVVERAPAKLNLRLEVSPRRGSDGFHPLRSLLVTLDGLHDTVRLRRAPRRSVVCPGVPERSNLAWRALDALEAECGRPLPVRVEIDKRIPARAGLGGGSSDAAATLRAANRLFALGVPPGGLERIGADLGSDVPFFVRGGAQWATGRGERLIPASAPGFAAVLVSPGVGLSTADVYARHDAMRTAGAGRRPGGPPPAMPTLAAWVGNDLWPAALACAPALGAAARALRVAGARCVLLCGSGSSVAGLADDLDRARDLAGRLPDRFAGAVVSSEPHTIPPGAGART